MATADEKVKKQQEELAKQNNASGTESTRESLADKVQSGGTQPQTTSANDVTGVKQQSTTNTSGYASGFQEQLDDVMNRILNREKFSYDVNVDALYNQYKDQYTNLGKQAMRDTMGQAAALTGGYGNTYALNAGQQAYNGYLSQLTDKIPELYNLAYTQYQNEGDDLKDAYSILNSREQQDYDRYQDKISQANNLSDDQRSLAQTQVNYLLQMGITPNDDLLAAAGYDQQYIDAILSTTAGTASGASSYNPNAWLNADGSVNVKYIKKSSDWWQNYAAEHNLDPDTGALLSKTPAGDTDTAATGGSGTDGKYTYKDVANLAADMQSKGATTSEIKELINGITGDSNLYETTAGSVLFGTGGAKKDAEALIKAYGGTSYGK